LACGKLRLLGSFQEKRVRIRYLATAVLAALVGGLPLSTAFAQNAPASGYERSMPAPGPYEAKLDSLLAARTYDGLAKALVDVKDMDAAMRALNWLRAKSLNGGGLYIAYLYSASLWRMANSIPEPNKSGLQQSAAVQLQLALWLLRAEGFQCADTTAPGSRYAAVGGQLMDVGRYYAALPAATKKSVDDLAFRALTQLFKLRPNDVWMCSGGMAQYGKYFEKHPEVGNKPIDAPGQGGKTIVLPADPSILPDFVAFQDWKAKRRAALDKIADEIGAKRLSDYGDGGSRMR
jgi:hypothetical protein